MKYEEAMKRLEEIVARIEENKMDIDQIGDSLKEARDLIKFCKDKLYKTDEEIKKILAQSTCEVNFHSIYYHS